MKLAIGFCILFIILLQVFTKVVSSEYEASLINNVHVNHHTRRPTLGRSKSINRTCHYACKRRCSASSRQKICHRACRSCCLKCKCVPPGTSGNKLLCSCYARLTTHGGRPKCP